MKKEKEIDPRIESMESMQKYGPAKLAVLLAKAGDETGAKKALETLVVNIDAGKDGGELLKHFKSMGDQGDEQLRVIYANAYERERMSLSVGTLFEEVYAEQLREVIGDERYKVAQKTFDEYKDDSYGDIIEKMTATKAKIEKLQIQGKKEDVEKLGKKLEEMQRITSAIEGLEQLRILDPTRKLKSELIAMFESEKKPELAKAA